MRRSTSSSPLSPRLARPFVASRTQCSDDGNLDDKEIEESDDDGWQPTGLSMDDLRSLREDIRDQPWQEDMCVFCGATSSCEMCVSKDSRPPVVYARSKLILAQICARIHKKLLPMDSHNTHMLPTCHQL